jgi:predicted RND superfamily exporter protein/CRP-like cAMP-binding protein
VLREFSIVASSGLFFNYVITMMLVPAWLRVFGSKKSRSLQTAKALMLFQPMLNVICHIVHQRKGVTLTIVSLVSVVFLYGATQIRLNNNIMAYFNDESPIKIRANDIASNLAGIESFMVVLDAGIEDTFLNAKYLRQLDDVTSYIENSGDFDKATSFSDHMSMMNSAVNETSEIELPDDNFVISELSIFVNFDDVKQYIDQDFSRAVIQVRHSIGSSYEFKQAIKRLQSYIQKNVDNAIEVIITGESVLVNDAADSMALAQAISLLLILFMIFISVSLIFINIQAGLFSILPNLFPVIIMFGVMGYMGIPLDTGTAMIAVIAIGVIVDGTMHFMVRYNKELKKTYDENTAIGNTIRAEALPITSTSLSLAIGFLVLMQSSFLPIMYFGALSAVVIIVAMIAEFTLTPILLSTLRLVTLWDMLSLHLKEQLLNNCRLFDEMKEWQVRKLILLSRLQRFRAGQYIMREGEPANDMYILLDGGVDVTMADEHGEKLIKESPKEGRMFGMMRVGEEKVRATSAMATKDSEVLVISWKSIEQVTRFYPRISSLFFKNLSKMLGSRLLQEFRGEKSSSVSL